MGRTPLRKHTHTNEADLTGLPEDERIRIAALYVARGQIVNLTIEDEPSKVARYQRKFLQRGCAILGTTKGPEVGAVTIRVGPRPVGPPQITIQ